MHLQLGVNQLEIRLITISNAIEREWVTRVQFDTGKTREVSATSEDNRFHCKNNAICVEP
tara:strand:- start:711 stop:890 length:180 start_codon:yes stop_codon:yes gene_type:complete